MRLFGYDCGDFRKKVEENSLEGLAEVQVHTGSRYCNEEELKEIMTTVHDSPAFTCFKDSKRCDYDGRM